jgi:argininosuccinate lyase
LAREKRQMREFNQVDLAHTVMLAEQGILTPNVAKMILQALIELRGMEPAAFPIDPLRGSFLLQVEAHLFSRIGEDIGGQMHTGRSRIDQGTTVRRLYERNRTVELLSRAAQETIGEPIKIDEPTIRDALDPEIFVRTRVTVGSVSPAEVNRMLEVARTGLADNGVWLAAERARLARAATKLDAAVDAIISA